MSKIIIYFDAFWYFAKNKKCPKSLIYKGFRHFCGVFVWSKWQDSNLQHLAPKLNDTDFCVIYKAFRGFCVGKWCFWVLLQALFPRSPNLWMVKTVVKPVFVGYGCYQEIENPTSQKFFFCRYYTIHQHNSQAPSLNTQNLHSSSQRKAPWKKMNLFSKKCWTSSLFCGMLLC